MSETEVEVEKIPTQLEVQTSLLGLESSEMEVEVEVEKIPIQLEVQTRLVVPV